MSDGKNVNAGYFVTPVEITMTRSGKGRIIQNSTPSDVLQIQIYRDQSHGKVQCLCFATIDCHFIRCFRRASRYFSRHLLYASSAERFYDSKTPP